MNWTDMIGYAASAMVLATFCMSTMCRLRLMAIASNILFICFGALANIHPVLLLHLALLPINLTRLLKTRAPVAHRENVFNAGTLATSEEPPGLSKDIIAVDHSSSCRRVL